MRPRQQPPGSGLSVCRRRARSPSERQRRFLDFCWVHWRCLKVLRPIRPRQAASPSRTARRWPQQLLPQPGASMRLRALAPASNRRRERARTGRPNRRARAEVRALRRRLPPAGAAETGRPRPRARRARQGARQHARRLAVARRARRRGKGGRARWSARPRHRMRARTAAPRALPRRARAAPRWAHPLPWLAQRAPSCWLGEAVSLVT